MASNSITNYLSNIAKSVKFAAIESVSDKTPNIQKLFNDSNKKYVQEVYKDISQNKQKMNMVERFRNATVFRQISTGWENLKDSVKTGKFKDDSRSSGVDEMEMLMSMLGDDLGADFDTIEAEMNGEEIGSTNDHRVHGIPEVTRGDALVATASARATGRAAKTISKAIVNAAELSDLTARKSINLQLKALQEHANILSTGFQNLSSSLHAINQFNNQVVLTNAQNSRLFYEQATHLAQERNAILKEMLEMQRQTFNATIKTKDQSQDFSDFKRIFDKDKGFDLRAYGNLLQKRMKETPIGQMMMFIKMLPMAIGDVVQNPLHHLAKMGIDSILDNSLKKAISNIDESINGYISTAFTKLFNYGKDKATKNTLLGKIAGFFGVKNENTRLSAVDTSKYNKEAMQWNGIAQKALVEVIPGHLRRIEAALTGEGERAYDFQGGKWSTMKRVATQERDLNDKIFKQIFSKTKNNILNNMSLDRDQLRGWNNALDDFFKGVQERGMIDYQHINNYRDKYGKNENVVKAIELMLHSGFIDPSEIAKLTTKINEGNAKKAEIIKNLNPSNQSLINEAMNNSYSSKWATGTGATFNEKGKQTGIGPDGRFLSRPINDLTKLVDVRGYTLYDYQYNIWQTLKNMSGGFGGGNRGGASPNFSGGVILGSDGKPIGGEVRTGLANKTTISPERQVHVAEVVANARAKADIRRNYAHPDRSGVSEEDKFGYGIDTIANATPEELALLIPVITEIGKMGKENRANVKQVKNTGLIGEAKSLLGGLGVDSTDSFLKNMTEAVTIADKFNVVGDALKSMTSAPQKIMTSVLTEADRFMYDFLFGNPAGTEKDENGQPIEGFFGKVTHEFGKTMDNLNNKFNEWFKDTFKEGAKGLSGLIKGFAQNYLGIDIDEKVKSAKRKVKKYTNKFKRSAYGVGAELFGIAKDSVLGTAQDLGLYEPDEEDAKSGKPTTAYRGINKYTSRYGIGVVGPGEKIISPGRGKVLDNTTGYKAYTLQYGDSVIPSYLNPSNAGRGRVTPQSLASQEYNEKALAKNVIRGNIPVLGTFAAGSLGWIDDLKAQENREDNTPKLGDKAKTKTRSRFSQFLDLMMGYDRPEFTEDQIKMQDFISNIVNSATKAAIEANGGAFEDENQKGRSITQAGFEMAGKIRKSGVNLNSKEFQEALEEVLAMKENIKDPDFRDTLRFILETAGYQGNFATEDESKQKRRSRRRGIFTGVNQFMTAAFGIDADKAVKTADKEIRKNLPELVKGGTLGLLASTVLPLGGPLMGAIVGAGASILTRNKSFQEYVFGKEITDDKGNVVGRDNSGLVSQKTVKTIQKYWPDAKKYGITGALSGLILPFGPLGGMMIGAGASILKNNQSFQDFMFGEKGGLINKDRKERIKRALPQIGAATLGTMFFGPFGLMGNAIVGAGLGILSTTESFKRIMLGSKDKNGIRRGGLADVIRRQITEPFKSTMQDVSKRLASWFKDDIFNPIARTVKPLGRNIAGEVKNLARAAADKIFGTSQQNGFLGRLGLKSVDRLLTGVRNAGGLGKWVAGGIGGALGTVAHGLENQVGKRLERRAFRKGFFESGTTAEERMEKAAELGIDINDANQYALGGLDQLMAKIKQGPNAQEELEDLSSAIALIQANRNGTKNDINQRIRGEQDHMRSMSEKIYQDYLKKNPNEKNPHDLHRKLESIQKKMTNLANAEDFDPNAAKGIFGQMLAKSGLPTEIQNQLLDTFLESGSSIKKYQTSLAHFGDNNYAKDIFAKQMGYEDYKSADDKVKKQIDSMIEHAESQAAVDNELNMMKDAQKNDESTNAKLREQLTEPGDKLITNNQEIEINELKIMNQTLETISKILSTNDPEERKKFQEEFNANMEKYKGSTQSSKVANAIEESKKYVEEEAAKKTNRDKNIDIVSRGLKNKYTKDYFAQNYDKNYAKRNKQFQELWQNDQDIKNIRYTYQNMMDIADPEKSAALEKEMGFKIEGRKKEIWDEMHGNTMAGAFKHDARVIGNAIGNAATNVTTNVGAAIQAADTYATNKISNSVHDIKNSDVVQENFNKKSIFEMGRDLASGILSFFKDIPNSFKSNDDDPPPTATYGLPFYGTFAGGGVLSALGNGLKEGVKGFAKGAFSSAALGGSDNTPKESNNIKEIQTPVSNIQSSDIKSTAGMVASFDHSKANGGAPDINTKDNISYTSDADGNPVAITKGPDGTPMKVHNKDNEELEKKHKAEFSFKERSANALEAIAAKLGAKVKGAVSAVADAGGGLFGGLLDSIGGLINTLFLGLPVGTWLISKLKSLPGKLFKLLGKLVPNSIKKFGADLMAKVGKLPGKLGEMVGKGFASAKSLVGKKLGQIAPSLTKNLVKVLSKSRIGALILGGGAVAAGGLKALGVIDDDENKTPSLPPGSKIIEKEDGSKVVVDENGKELDIPAEEAESGEDSGMSAGSLAKSAVAGYVGREAAKKAGFRSAGGRAAGATLANVIANGGEVDAGTIADFGMSYGVEKIIDKVSGNKVPTTGLETEGPKNRPTGQYRNAIEAKKAELAQQKATEKSIARHQRKLAQQAAKSGANIIENNTTNPSLWDKAKTAASSLKDWASSKFSTGTESAKSVFKTGMNSEAANKIKDTSTLVKDNAKQGVEAAVGKIRSAMQTVVEAAGKWLPGKTVGEAVSNFCKKIMEKVTSSQGMQILQKKLSQQAATAAGGAALGIGAVAIGTMFCVTSFISGYNHAAEQFGVQESVVTNGMKVISGLVHAIHCAIGLIPIVGIAFALIVSPKQMLDYAIDLIGPAVGLSKQDLQKLQKSGQSVVDNNIKAAQEYGKGNPEINDNHSGGGFFDTVKETASGAWDKVKSVGSSLLNGAKSIGSSLYNGAKSVGSSLVSGAKSLGSAAWNGLTSLGSRAYNFVTGKGKHSTYGRGGLFGTGFHSQLDPAIAGMGFNISGDTEKQTVKDSACGPMAMANAIESFGTAVDDEDIINKTKSGKEKNGGTPDYVLNKYAKDKGFSTRSIGTSAKDIANSLRAGNPLVLMGQNDAGETDKDPYAENPHYVTAKGLDREGNVIVQDPESYQPIKKYKLNDLAKSTTIATEVGKEPKFSEGASLKEIMAWRMKHAGRSRYGRGPQTPEMIWNFLNPKLGSVATAAIMGNIEAESGYDPGAVNKSSGASGLCQWLGGRKTAMMDVAKSMGKPWNTEDPQLAYLWQEMDQPWLGKTFKQWAKEINDAGDPEAGAEKWEKLFERSGHTASYPRRRQSAREAFEKQGKGIKTSGNSYGSSNTNEIANEPQESGIFGALSQLARKIGSIINIFGSDDSSSGSPGSISGGSVNYQDAAKKIVECALAYEKSKIQYGQVNPPSPPKDGGQCDCSGMAQNCYKAAGIEIPRTADIQCAFFKKHNATFTGDMKQLKAGDLVFTTKPGEGVDHVFVYIGDGKAVNLGGRNGKGSNGGDARLYNGWDQIKAGIDWHGGPPIFGSLEKLCSASGTAYSGYGKKRSSTNRIVIHHTAGQAGVDPDAKTIDSWHKNNGWSGIGYHFVIRKSGSIENGRAVDEVGAHAEGANNDSIGIHVGGNFDLEQPTDKQIESLVSLIRQLCKKYNIPIDRKHILGHREVGQTACPGKNLYNQLDSIVAKAAGSGKGKSKTSKFGKGKSLNPLDKYTRFNKPKFGQGKYGRATDFTFKNPMDDLNKPSKDGIDKMIDGALLTPEDVKTAHKAGVTEGVKKENIKALEKWNEAKEKGEEVKVFAPEDSLLSRAAAAQAANQNDTSLMDKFFGGASKQLDLIKSKIDPIKSALFSKLGSVITEKFGKYSEIIGDPLGMFKGLFGSSNNGSNGGSSGGAGASGTFDGDYTKVDTTGSAGESLRKAMNTQITSKYGMRGERFHNGIDLGVDVGTPVPTPVEGTIDDVGAEGGYGNFVVVKDKKGFYHIFAHLSQQLVQKGVSVKSGHIVAKSGNTGKGDGPHLHYGIYKPGYSGCGSGDPSKSGSVNPMTYSVSGLTSDESKDGKGKNIYGTGRYIKIRSKLTRGTDAGLLYGNGKEATIYEDLAITQNMDPITNIPQELKGGNKNFGITDKPIFGKGKYGKGFDLENLGKTISKLTSSIKSLNNSIHIDPMITVGGGFGGAINQQKINNTNKNQQEKKAANNKLIAPNGKPYLKNDIDYILKNPDKFNGAKTVDDAIAILSKDKKYANKLIGPNGLKYEQNDIDYILKNPDKFGGAKTVDDAIAILSKDKKYTDKEAAAKQKADKEALIKKQEDRIKAFNNMPAAQRQMFAQMGLIPTMGGGIFGEQTTTNQNQRKINTNIGQNKFSNFGNILGGLVGSFSSKAGNAISAGFSLVGTIGNLFGLFIKKKKTDNTDTKDKIKNYEEALKILEKDEKEHKLKSADIKKLLEEVPEPSTRENIINWENDDLGVIRAKAITYLKEAIAKTKEEEKKAKEAKDKQKESTDSIKKDQNSITKAKDDSKFKLGQEGSHGKGPNGKPYSNNDIAYILKNPDKFGGAKTVEDAIKILEKDKKYTETAQKDDKSKSEAGTQAKSEQAKDAKTESKQDTVTTDTSKASEKASEANMSPSDKLDALLAAQNKTNELLAAILTLATNKLDVKETNIKPVQKNNVNTGEPAPKSIADARSQLNYFYSNSMKNSGVDMSFFNPDSGDPIDITKRMQSIASM